MSDHPLQSLLDRAVAVIPFTMSPEDTEFIQNTVDVGRDIPVVHFMRTIHFLSLLHSSQLRAKRLDLYADTDPYEGLYPAENQVRGSSIEAQIEAALPVVTDKKAMAESQCVERTYTYIHCWFEGSHRDKRMWEHYGHSGKGVCIATTTTALQRALQKHPVHLIYHLGRCTYRDESEPIPECISIAPAFRKRRKFDWEQEIRILAQIPMEHLPHDDAGYLTEAAEVQYLPVDLNTLIQGVITGPNIAAEEIGEIVQIASTLSLADRIRPF